MSAVHNHGGWDKCRRLCHHHQRRASVCVGGSLAKWKAVIDKWELPDSTEDGITA